MVAYGSKSELLGVYEKKVTIVILSKKFQGKQKKNLSFWLVIDYPVKASEEKALDLT